MSDSPQHEYQRYLNGLPDDWARMEVRQLGRVVSGGTPSRDAPSFWNGDIPWVTPGEVSRNRSKFLIETNECISNAGLLGSGAGMLPVESLLVTTRATLGARVINSVPMTTNQGFKSIVFKDPSDSKFYFHLFEKVRPELVRRASGTTFLEISGAEFGSIEVPSPSSSEKRAVAQVLDTLDDAIAQTEAIIAKLKAAKLGLLHDLLTRGIDANGELRPPQSEAPQFYKRSALGWIPREWDTGTIAAMAELLDNQRVPVNETERMKRPGVVPYYGANGQQGWIDRPLFNEPLILLAEDGGNFDDFAWRPIAYRIDGESWVNNHAHVLRSRPDCDQAFIFFALEHRDIRKYISGGTRTKLTAGELKSIELPRPGFAEQGAIALRLEAIAQRVSSEAAMRDKLLAEKIGLMDDLLTGRIRVTLLLEGAVG